MCIYEYQTFIVQHTENMKIVGVSEEDTKDRDLLEVLWQPLKGTDKKRISFVTSTLTIY